MSSKTTTIGGIHAELDTYVEDGEERSTCMLSKERNGSNYGASLALAEHLGGLPFEDGPGDDSLPTNDYGEEHYPVSRRTLDSIIAWAVANGY